MVITLIFMTMKTRTVPAGEFKAKCLALMDEVAASGETIIVTKRGRPVVRVMAAGKLDPRVALKGSGRAVGDILAPFEDWQAWSEEEKFS